MEKMQNKDFYHHSVYCTVRKAIGRAVWISEYKKDFGDDSINDVSGILDNSAELIKKELRILDELSRNNSKNRSTFE
eukprot:CAMPEP_0170561540 /NCGR_PEP_ID=MMETSP0211-20121228/55380_1 /TAXON_ID=311385 /ORGANISM="Pseudokeronopsis sp., Strain OXSARD2" /LENGTH=76 /DNA_ID=CAMNT_0010877213 /DNA_START=171 /DNA_END=401 /DNA_ORIENTATION=-